MSKQEPWQDSWKLIRHINKGGQVPAMPIYIQEKFHPQALIELDIRYKRWIQP